VHFQGEIEINATLPHGAVLLLGAWFLLVHVRFKQYSRDVVHLVEVAMAEAGETQPTRQRFMNSHVFAVLVHDGYGTRPAFETAKAALSYFDENFERFRAEWKHSQACLR
jgi:hypothetical protein